MQKLQIKHFAKSTFSDAVKLQKNCDTHFLLPFRQKKRLHKLVKKKSFTLLILIDSCGSIGKHIKPKLVNFDKSTFSDDVGLQNNGSI